MPITIFTRENNFDRIGSALALQLNTAVREQVFVTERDAKGNIQKYGLIDTGTMLNSVQGTMTGKYSGEISVSAQSAAGYPYPAAQNFGTRYIPASPFMSEAATKAESEFPRRIKHLVSV